MLEYLFRGPAGVFARDPAGRLPFSGHGRRLVEPVKLSLESGEPLAGFFAAVEGALEPGMVPLGVGPRLCHLVEGRRLAGVGSFSCHFLTPLKLWTMFGHLVPIWPAGELTAPRRPLSFHFARLASSCSARSLLRRARPQHRATAQGTASLRVRNTSSGRRSTTIAPFRPSYSMGIRTNAINTWVVLR